MFARGVAYAAGGARVGLDAASVLAVGDGRFGERHAIEIIIALATNRAYAKSMAANTCHTRDEDISAAGHSDAVVLIVNCGVLEGQTGS